MTRILLSQPPIECGANVQIFVDDPSVLFVSTHQSGGYPGTGKISEAGTGDGLGATINIPLPGFS